MTRIYDIPGFGEVIVNVNSDYSGEAYIRWEREGEPLVAVRIPGELLLTLGKQAGLDYVRRETISFLEQLDGPCPS